MSSSTKKLPDHITMSVAFLAPIEPLVRRMFVGIYHDYLRRFKLTVPDTPRQIAICGVGAGPANDPHRTGFTVCTEERVMIHVRDPNLDESPGNISHFYVAQMFVNVLCHEMVHAMQDLTDRKMDGMYRMPHSKKAKGETYFFDPFEIEARILEAFYTEKFGTRLQKFCET